MGTVDDRAQPHRAKTAFLVLGIFCCPLLLCSAFIALSRCLPDFPSTAVMVFGFSISVVSGLPFIFHLPISKKVKVGLGIAYVPIAMLVTLMYTLAFACSVYGDCL